MDKIEIKKWCTAGDVERVAVECGVVPSYVRKVLNGSRTNEDILLKCEILAAHNQGAEAQKAALVKINR